MTDHRDRYDGTEPDLDADRWSAWLPPLDPTSDHTGAADPAQATPPLPQSPGPALPQSPGPALPQYPAPAVPAAPSHAKRAYVPYRPAPTPPQGSWTAPPRSHLGMAIVSIIFGFTLFGIIAVVKAASVNSLWAQGRTSEAARASRLARNWAIAAFGLTAVWFVIAIFIPGVMMIGP